MQFFKQITRRNITRLMSKTETSIVFDTQILKVDPASISFAPDAHITGAQPTISDPQTRENLLRAVEILQASDYNVAFPTETVYGLGGSSLNSSAILNIYRAKNRPSDNPLITHIASLDQLNRVIYRDSREQSSTDYWARIPQQYHQLLSHMWPGPLTILLPVPEASDSDSAQPGLSPLTTAGQPTFAVRFPSHPVARALISMSDLPIAAPSANTSTKPSPTNALHVYHDLQGKIPVILDGGDCAVGVESSVVDCITATNPDTHTPQMLLLRPGGFTLEEISKMSGIPAQDIKVECVLKNENAKVRTPGMKYKHYSPSCKVYLFVPQSRAAQARAAQAEDDHKEASISEKIAEVCQSVVEEGHENIKKIAVLTTYHFEEELAKTPLNVPGTEVLVKSLGHDGGAIQRNIFKYLRDLDESDHVDVIFIEGVFEENEGLAIMNRLNKSSGGNTIPFSV